jgi:hypothetical protein
LARRLRSRRQFVGHFHWPTISPLSHPLSHYSDPASPEPVQTVIYLLCRGLMMGKNLYCGNLSFDVSSSDLEQLFSEFGSVVSAQVIQDRDTGRSKGFGFVEMGSDAEAAAAIQSLNGVEHNGRSLKVNEAKPREPRRSGSHGRGGHRGGRY